MRPRIILHRITALLAAYAFAVATAVMPLSLSATRAEVVACLAGGGTPASMPDNAPESDHASCGLCAAEVSVAPRLGGTEIARLGRAPARQLMSEQSPPARAHVGPGLPRAPPRAA